MELKVKRLPHFEGELPKYETAGASGFDVRAQIGHDIHILPGKRVIVPTALAFEIPEGYELQSRPRSGRALKEGLSITNTPGTIDADYRGEVSVQLINHDKEEVISIKPQERVCQLVLCPVVQAELVEYKTLTPTVRGYNGHGSTGS